MGGYCPGGYWKGGILSGRVLSWGDIVRGDIVRGDIVLEPPTLPMVVWSKAMPLTASCLSPLPGFEPQPGHVRKNSVT